MEEIEITTRVWSSVILRSTPFTLVSILYAHDCQNISWCGGPSVRRNTIWCSPPATHILGCINKALLGTVLSQHDLVWTNRDQSSCPQLTPKSRAYGK